MMQLLLKILSLIKKNLKHKMLLLLTVQWFRKPKSKPKVPLTLKNRLVRILFLKEVDLPRHQMLALLPLLHNNLLLPNLEKILLTLKDLLVKEALKNPFHKDRVVKMHP